MYASMRKFLQKLVLTLKAYGHYFEEWLKEVYIYYTSPYPLILFLKRFALANRKIRIVWGSRSVGRKPLDQKTINLILELKNLNPKWGAQKISDELMKIGYLACKKTVLKYLEIYGLGPEPSSRAMPWGEFLANHKFKIGIDFTCLISLSGRQLFIFVIKNLDSREVLLINSTFYPNSSWITQQFRNASYDLDVYPSLFLCDRDRIFSKWFPHMMRDYFGTKVKYTPPKSPWKKWDRREI